MAIKTRWDEPPPARHQKLHRAQIDQDHIYWTRANRETNPIHWATDVLQLELGPRYDLPLKTFKRHINMLMKDIGVSDRNKPIVRAELVTKYKERTNKKRGIARHQRAQMVNKQRVRYRP